MDQALIDQVKGFLDPREGRRLYELALEASRMGPCLEIGGYCGKSTVWLGTACRRNGMTLYSVDHHRGSVEQQPGEPYFDPELFEPGSFRIDTFPWFRATVETAGLEDTVVPVVCASRLAARHWKTPLALIFIDGSHDFESVEEDFRLWSRHLVTGGYLLLHDVFKDPAKGGQGPYLVYRNAVSLGIYHVLPMTGCLGVLRRKA